MKIKICGLFRDEDIDYVNEAKPDYIGFVFAESKRKISEETAEHLKLKLDPSIIAVGVFIDSSIEKIVRLYKNNVISMAQLHGNEDALYISKLRNAAVCTNKNKLDIIKAVKIDQNNIVVKEAYNADYLLFDSGAGSGKTFDWSVINSNEIQRSFLAGGINCDNIKDAVKINPYCIDVSSGAETNGLKDKAKIMQLVIKMRTYYKNLME
ncbi:MAG: hypothetical protein LBV52_02900 [Spirochaetaceae bacterium]|nr:hypothetical protein [Spirochaetaceae bacterium]